MERLYCLCPKCDNEDIDLERMVCRKCGHRFNRRTGNVSSPMEKDVVPIPRTIREIDTSSWEGKLLIMAIARISCEGRYTSMAPDEILEILNQVTLIVYAKNLEQ